MHLDVNALIALGVFTHLGASLAKMLLHSQADQAKVERFEAKANEIIGQLTAIVAATGATNGGGTK